MHYIIIERAPAKSQAAGNSERFGLVETEFGGRDLYRRWKAAVEVHKVEIVDIDVRQFEHPPTDQANARRRVEVVPYRRGKVIVPFHARVWIDPLALGYAKPARSRHRAHDQRRAHIHRHIRIHQFGVGEADASIGWRGRPNLFGRVILPYPGMRIIPCRVVETRPQFRDANRVFLERFAPVMTDGVFVHGIHLDRRTYPLCDFVVMMLGLLIAEQNVVLAGRLAQIDFYICLSRLCRTVAILCAGNQHEIEFPGQY